MVKFSIAVLDSQMNTKAEATGEDEVSLVYEGQYEEGDSIQLKMEQENAFVWLQWDDVIGKSLVYLTGDTRYKIPFGEKKLNLSPNAFSGEKHLITVRTAQAFELESYRNLALNVCDQHEIENLYPHAVANVETRGESVFAAQNAIDGVTVNHSHGEWPYQSWGINRQDDAKIRIDFGRMVEIDKIVLYTRADFPHDNWWEQVTFCFSDGSTLDMQMEKSSKPHSLQIPPRKVTWIEMCDMKKADDPSPFPALSQIEVYGK